MQTTRFRGAFEAGLPLPTTDLVVWRRMHDLKEAFLVTLCIEIYAVSYFVEERTADAVVSNSIAKVEHRIGFAPVFSILPDFNGGATDFVCELDQTGIVRIAPVGQKDTVVFRD